MDTRTRPTKAERGVVWDKAIRLGPMLALPAILDEFGVETDTLLGAVGLVRADFGDPENVVPFHSVDTLLRLCREATGCDHLGVLIGREITLRSLGAIGVLMQASPTVGDAHQVLHRYLHIHDRGAVVEFDVYADRVYLRYLVVVPDLRAVDQIYTIAGLAGCNLLRELCGTGWQPTEVQLPFSPTRNRAVYRDAFGAPLRFNAERLAVVFQTSHLARRPPKSDAAIWQTMSTRVRALEAALRLTLPDQVRRLLRSMVFEQNAMREALAERLGVSARTLNRQLSEAGTSVRQLHQEVLADTACQLLLWTNKSATEIGAVLGYCEASAFTRAFRRWRGVGPAEWRAAANAAVAERPSA
jgi:AraC-like DNA-binding protein